MSSRNVKVTHYVDDWVLIAAAVVVKRTPAVRLSKSSVLTQAADWYEMFGSQLNSGDYSDLGEDSPEQKEYEQAATWVQKYWEVEA